ncbi:FAD:protein FMN transferase [Afipia sp. GAS231]|uniref:FAD:protein FMN transferase n=1 Tax=Afipia sp. GAS231 TaxID=1882747 RepID=UPI00087C1849|nr:FAD:protein FMN transferase [Afipia sp. GAS231]SDO23322.1 thiamine biosynthesis lipoprotein [Afipia sp. GAS231]
MAIASDSLRRARPLLGTYVEITVAGATAPAMEAAVNAAFETIATVHRLMSFHEADSDVSRLNREAHLRAVGVHDWTFQVLQMAVDLHRRSGGIFDVAVAPALQWIGLLPRMDDRSPTATEPRSFDAIELLQRQTVRFLDRGVAIDLGGIAKGFAVDRALQVLRGLDMPSGLVNAGGDLAGYGPDPHTVHIRDPRDPRRLICRVEVTNEALATTARRFDLFHSADTTGSAVIDPVTSRPADGIDGATVRAPSCMVADALTKIAMISGTDALALLEHYNAEALLISTDGDIQITPGWHQAVHLAA